MTGQHQPLAVVSHLFQIAVARQIFIRAARHRKVRKVQRFAIASVLIRDHAELGYRVAEHQIIARVPALDLVAALQDIQRFLAGHRGKVHDLCRQTALPIKFRDRLRICILIPTAFFGIAKLPRPARQKQLLSVRTAVDAHIIAGRIQRIDHFQLFRQENIFRGIVRQPIQTVAARDH